MFSNKFILLPLHLYKRKQGRLQSTLLLKEYPLLVFIL